MPTAEQLKNAQKRIILPLDGMDAETALIMATELRNSVGLFKVGMELFYQEGAGHELVRILQELAPDVGIMLDLKLHDIPATMQGALKSVRALKPRFLTVHAGSGIGHLAACVDMAGPDIGILGVTVLTSIDDEAFRESGGAGSIAETVMARAKCAAAAKCAGIVCSPQELASLKGVIDSDVYRITPGVRPLWAAANDQKRVMTPGEAIAAGASYLVIGRPILKPPPDIGTPQDAARLIAEEIAECM